MILSKFSQTISPGIWQWFEKESLISPKLSKIRQIHENYLLSFYKTWIKQKGHLTRNSKMELVDGWKRALQILKEVDIM